MSLDNLSKNLKERRHQNGWTQGHVAKALDISIPAYSKIETGLTDVNLSRVERLAIFYKTSVIALITNNENDAKEILRIESAIQKLGAEIMELQRRVIELHQKLRA
jgi:transcriptional regulator with XRE-family HTH domain